MEYTLTRNTEFNSIEITFDGKPSEEIRNRLKTNHFRWHGQKKVWYGYKTEEEVISILEGKTAVSEAVTKPQSHSGKERFNSEELTQKAREEYRKTWGDDSKMMDYCMKKIDVIVPLENGGIIVLDKPSIETQFCYGYGYCGMSTEEEIDGASRCAAAIREEDNFKEENLRDLNEHIETIKHLKKREFSNMKEFTWWVDRDYNLTALVLQNSYEDTPGLYNYGFASWDRLEYLRGKGRAFNPTEKDIENIIAGLEEQKRRFEKRLNTYLKKYGTSKLHTWTYLRD